MCNTDIPQRLIKGHELGYLCLGQMIVLNYKPRLKEIENTINRWSKQTLTPFGKITIIKTLIISKLNL
jgi:hypothetical protein